MLDNKNSYYKKKKTQVVTSGFGIMYGITYRHSIDQLQALIRRCKVVESTLSCFNLYKC